MWLTRRKTKKIVAAISEHVYTTVLGMFDDYGRPQEPNDIRLFVEEARDWCEEFEQDMCCFYTHRYPGAHDFLAIVITTAAREAFINACARRDIVVSVVNDDDVHELHRLAIPHDREKIRQYILDQLYTVPPSERKKRALDLTTALMSTYPVDTGLVAGVNEAMKEAGIDLMVDKQ